MRDLNEEFANDRKKRSISTIQKQTPYIHFICEGDQVMNILKKYFDPTVNTGFEYSLDQKEWFDLKDEIPFTNNLWLRGKNQYGTYDVGYYIDINFMNNIPIDVEGDIRTLVDWENYEQCNEAKVFSLLFVACIKSPKLIIKLNSLLLFVDSISLSSIMSAYSTNFLFSGQFGISSR